MALETANFINGLNSSNPQATDSVSQADDHIRLLKATIKATFPNVAGAVTKTHTEINDGLEKSGGTMTGTLVLSGAPSSDLHAATKAYVDSAVSPKASSSTTITAGTGLTGGGSLASNRTLAIADGGVDTTQLAAGAVTTEKVEDAAITQAKLADTIYTTDYQSKGNSGYQKLPGGFTIQWGTGTSTTDNAQTFSFPTAFASACYAVMVQRNDSGAENVLAVTSDSTTGFTITRDPNINTSVAFTYIAIGY